MLESDILAKVFAQLGKEKELLAFRDILFQTMGLVMDFANAEGQTLRLSRGDNFAPLCRCMRKTPGYSEQCHNCDIMNLQKAAEDRKPLVYTCHTGLIEIVVPLFDHKGEYLGSLTSGQFRRAGKSAGNKTYLREFAAAAGLTGKQIEKMYAGSKVLTKTQIDGLIGYLQMVGRILVTAHHNLLFMESIDMPERMTLVKQYIHEHFSEALSLTQMARRFSLAPEYLCRLFRKECGVGFNTYLNYYRIEKARDFLLNSQLYIAKIADLTGFGSVVQFNRIFRRLTGMSPAEWRKEHKTPKPADDLFPKG